MIYIIFCCVISQVFSTILFSQQSTIIKLNKNVEINCILNNTNKTPTHWYINDSIILSNSTKYKYNMSSLIIKNVTTDDLNSIYKCEFNNISKSNKIIIDESTFIHLPEKKYIEIIYFSNAIDVQFYKVYPISYCYIDLPENTFESKRIETRNKFYYYTRTYFGFDYMKECGQNKTIFCTLSNEKFEINITTELCVPCVDTTNNNNHKKLINTNNIIEQSDNTLLFVNIILIILILFVSFFLTFVLSEI